MLPLSDFPINRAAVFAHFDIDNRLDNYVIYYLRRLKEVCTCIIFITTSHLPEKEILKINELCEKVIIRENTGHDFMSYKNGLSILKTGRYDEILLCNDSVYGPFFPLKHVFNKMQGEACDFWGITENHDVAYHIQSYFIVFKKKVIQSSHFWKFWDQVSIESNKSEIIRKYEIGMSQFLIKNEFIPDAYIKVKKSYLKIFKAKIVFMSIKNYADIIKKIVRLINPGSKIAMNPTRFYWKELITEYNMPFIKIDILRDSFKNINTENSLNIIDLYSDYDTSLIQKHLERVKTRYTIPQLG